MSEFSKPFCVWFKHRPMYTLATWFLIAQGNCLTAHHLLSANTTTVWLHERFDQSKNHQCCMLWMLWLLWMDYYDWDSLNIKVNKTETIASWLYVRYGAVTSGTARLCWHSGMAGKMLWSAFLLIADSMERGSIAENIWSITPDMHFSAAALD